MKIEGCYASSLDECSGKISDEHVLSKSILDDHIQITFNGKTTKYKKGEYILPNLCSYHNSKLSPADNQMAAFTRFMFEDSELFDPIKNGSVLENSIKFPRRINVRGKNLENWILKTAINHSWKRNNRKPNLNFNYICKRLFQKKQFEYPFGLSIYQIDDPLRGQFQGASEFYDHSVIHDLTLEEELYGFTVNAQGTVFFILLPTEHSHLVHKGGVNFNGKNYKIRMHLPSETQEEFGSPTLIWHPKGYQTTQLNYEGIRIMRSLISIKW